MRLILSLLCLLSVCVFAVDVSAQDDRLIGTWTIDSSVLPPNSALKIVKNGSVYEAFPAVEVTVPPPFSCTARTTDRLVVLTPNSATNYTMQLFAYSLGSCELADFGTYNADISFNADASQFSICSGSDCSYWKKPSAISKKTVPPAASVAVAKGSIAVTCRAVLGAYAYRIVVAGPTTIGLTLKKSRFAKFNKLKKGSYKVTYIAFFKDAKGKTANTKDSKVVKVKVP